MPLHTACVLKLVNHVMIHPRPRLLVDKGGIAAVNHLAEQFSGVGDQEDVLLLAVGGNLSGNVREDAQRVIMAGYFFGSIIIRQVGEKGDDALDAIVQSVAESLLNGLAFVRRACLGKAAVHVIRQSDKGSRRCFHLPACQLLQKEQGRTATAFEIGRVQTVTAQHFQALFAQPLRFALR
ncbi:hypothetical protein Barb4_02537 [Bacteroidales bacterium Barb4]|nr:hypothetical protein Barb4_02537 [Bacteroidales bacterium Barb4]